MDSLSKPTCNVFACLIMGMSCSVGGRQATNMQPNTGAMNSPNGSTDSQGVRTMAVSNYTRQNWTCDRASDALSRVSSLHQLAGSYVLVLLGQEQRKLLINVGGLELRERADSAPARARTAIASPLWGWTYVDFLRFAATSLRVNPSSSDKERPGIEIRSDSTMIVGNPAPSGLPRARDTGVFLYIREIDQHGFRGTWVSGEHIEPTPQGMFCALRLE